MLDQLLGADERKDALSYGGQVATGTLLELSKGERNAVIPSVDTTILEVTVLMPNGPEFLPVLHYVVPFLVPSGVYQA